MTTKFPKKPSISRNEYEWINLRLNCSAPKTSKNIDRTTGHVAIRGSDSTFSKFQDPTLAVAALECEFEEVGTRGFPWLREKKNLGFCWIKMNQMIWFDPFKSFFFPTQNLRFLFLFVTLDVWSLTLPLEIRKNMFEISQKYTQYCKPDAGCFF